MRLHPFEKTATQLRFLSINNIQRFLISSEPSISKSINKSSLRLYSCLFFSALLLSLNLNATIDQDDVSYSGASNVVQDDDTGSDTVYGGLPTGAVCSSTNSDGTCNTCSGAADTVCNRNAIVSSSNLTITFKSDSASGYPKIVENSNNIQYGTYVNAGEYGTISVTWDEICDAIAADGDGTDCTDVNGNSTFTIGIGSTATDANFDDSYSLTIHVQNIIDSTAGTYGITDMSVYPGDEKVFIQQIDIASNFPNTNGLSIQRMLVFYTAGDQCSTYTNITNASNYFEVEFETSSSTGSISSTPLTDQLKGLTNGQEYTFKLAAQDLANNIGYFDTSCTSNQHVATPAEVYGLFDQEQNCFIATATYGSIFSDEVNTFRHFRDSVLKGSFLGRKFVSLYYKYSPPMAEFISENPILKNVSQVMLFPFWLLAKLNQSLGLWGFLTFFLIQVCFLLSIFQTFKILKPKLIKIKPKDKR